jgi:hypothetical protein
MSRRSVLSIFGTAVIALIVGSALGSALFSTRTTTTELSTESLTTTVSTIVTVTTVSQSRLFELRFVQQGACSAPQAFLAPWAVTLGNKTTIAEPSNATLPISESSFEAATLFQNHSTIVFSVPDGVYTYTVYPHTFLGQQGNSVIVNGSDATVNVGPPEISCTSSSG